MITDKALELSSAQVLTATAVSDNVIDLGASRDIGISNFDNLLISGSSTLASAGATTLEIQVQVSESVGFGTFKVASSSGPVAKADLVGKQIVMPIAVGTKGRYLRLNYVVATGPFTAGTITAQFTHGVQSNFAYPDAL